jgi:hypothetical protein
MRLVDVVDREGATVENLSALIDGGRNGPRSEPGYTGSNPRKPRRPAVSRRARRRTLRLAEC